MIKIKQLNYLSRHYREIPPEKLQGFDKDIIIDHGSISNKNKYLLSGSTYDEKYLRIGVCWIDSDNIYHELYQETGNIETWPTKSMELLVAIYPSKSTIFPFPKNIVVYNADGSIRHNVEAPDLEIQPEYWKMGNPKIKGIPHALYPDENSEKFNNETIKIEFFEKNVYINEIRYNGLHICVISW
jgi:hypothetical protein